MAPWLGRLRDAGRIAGALARSRRGGLEGGVKHQVAPPNANGDAALALEAELMGYVAARREPRLFVSEYPYEMKSRDFSGTLAGRKVRHLLGQSDSRCRAWLAAIRACAPQFREIGATCADDAAEP